MTQEVILDSAAVKELNAFPTPVAARFYDLLEILSKEGKLELPFAKKMNKSLFEIRVKHNG